MSGASSLSAEVPGIQVARRGNPDVVLEPGRGQEHHAASGPAIAVEEDADRMASIRDGTGRYGDHHRVGPPVGFLRPGLDQ